MPADYEGLSHQTLYDQLKAGDPEQVEGLASQWSSMSSTLSDLARSIETDLAALAGSWESAGATEFQNRLQLIASYASTMSDEFHRVGAGLTLQAAPLRTAQQQAESPEETDDHDKALGSAAKGSVFGVVGIVAGGIYGHQQDQEEQEKAHARMVQLVSGLAVDYEDTSPNTWGIPILDPPPELPGHTNTSGVALAAIAAARAVSKISGTGVGGGIGTKSTSASRTAQDGPTHGTPGQGTSHVVAPGTTSDITPATGLAGAGNDTTGGGATTGPGTGLAAAPGTGSGDGGSGVGTGNGGGLSTGGSLALGVGLLAGGAAILGGRPAMGGSSAGGGTGAGANAMNSTGRPVGGSGSGAGGETARAASAKSGASAGASGETARSASAGGKGGTPGKLGNVDLGVRQADSGGSRSAGTANSAAGGRGAQGNDDTDERTTWLTEDEMVWQGDNQAAPPVLGG